MVKPTRYRQKYRAPFWRLALLLLLMSSTLGAWGQDANPEEPATETQAEAAQSATESGRASSRPRAAAAAPTIVDRPFSPLESMNYETTIASQLRDLVGRYLSTSLFHVNVEIAGRVLSPGLPAGGADMEIDARVSGRPVDDEYIEEDKTLEMLPALPFFSSRLRAPVKVDAKEQLASPAGEEPKTPQRQPGQLYGPTVDRIRVFLMVDTSINEEKQNFYKSLISSAIKLNPGRGDELIVSTNVFPKDEVQQAQAGPPINVSARLESDPMQSQALMGSIESLGRNLSWLIGIGLVLLGILVFIGLVWRGKKQGAAQRDMRGLGEAAPMGEQQAVQNPLPQMLQGSTINLNAEFRHPMDAQMEQLKASDPLMDWLLNERTALAFVFERWYREQGSAGEQKAIMLLYPYGLQFFEMFSEHLEPKTAHSFDIAWRRWSPDQLDSVAQQRALDELTQAMKNQRQFGNFPFILYLKDEEIATLLQDEEPLPSLMVLDGILPARRSTILDLLGNEATAEILSSYPDMHDLKFDAYSELSSRLFKKLKAQREGKEARNEAAYRSVLQAIEEQSIKQQAIMVENMRTSNPDMYNYVRERVTLWSDVAGLDSSILQEALQGMESDKLAALLRDDEELQERILPLRPAREQLLIRDQISQGVYNADLTDQLRLDFLGRVRRIKNLQAANGAVASSAVTA